MNCSRLSRWLPWLHRTPLGGKVWRFFLPYLRPFPSPSPRFPFEPSSARRLSSKPIKIYYMVIIMMIKEGRIGCSRTSTPPGASSTSASKEVSSSSLLSFLHLFS